MICGFHTEERERRRQCFPGQCCFIDRRTTSRLQSIADGVIIEGATIINATDQLKGTKGQRFSQNELSQNHCHAFHHFDHNDFDFIGSDSSQENY